MVYRIYVEKKNGFEVEAKSFASELKTFLEIKGVEKVRVINRYDIEGVSQELFEKAVNTVFSEPQVDNASATLDCGKDFAFAVEPLPGQFDQRADSAAQCIQLISQGDKPLVKTAKIYIVSGNLTQEEKEKIKKFTINPVESREASFETYQTLVVNYDIPTTVKTIDGFITLDENGLKEFLNEYSLAMDLDDLKFCQAYFVKENRNPTITEIRMLDTYWSDHCRHTTFLTTIDSVKTEDKLLEKAFNEYIALRKELNRTKPINLMDLATIAVRKLKKDGKLEKLDQSEEINACTVKIQIEVDGEKQDYLLLFKNETHNHPTEIEPFGGAATCIGGAIRDPLSGRAYVYSAMRVTGAGDPLKDQSQTLKGKLSQRKIVTTAASGYSSYGNQIGLATGLVDEIYDEGYTAKRMEIGAVVGAVPQNQVRRETPVEGDVVILLGGRTGRDGCGGATGSSKSHTVKSIENCGAEVQKGNAPEERKLQRLFRNKEASLLIKRCNDFGAGGVSVAIGELADGLEIDLDKVRKKYDGLDGTELAISESQERMAVVVEGKDASRFMELADSENLEATIVAKVTEKARLVMKWNGNVICDISRDFLNSNGAEKHIDVELTPTADYSAQARKDFATGMKELVGELNICSKRGLSERFDSTIGAGTVLMPFGGKYQLTPNQAMVNKISLEKGFTKDCSVMAYGFNPEISKKSPYHGAYLAVVESVSKLIASGANFEDVYLTFQEYFAKPQKCAKRWGQPATALLGAFKAQMELGIGSIGGKDSMSGSFEDIDVPPTLVSFAVTTCTTDDVVSGDFKKAGSKVYLIKPEYDENNLPNTQSLIDCYNKVAKLNAEGKILSCYTPVRGGIAEAIFKMAIGNKIGFEFATDKGLFDYNYGAFILETSEDLDEMLLGNTIAEEKIVCGKDSLCLNELLTIYENKLEPVFSCNIKTKEEKIEKITYTQRNAEKGASIVTPRVLIPVFPGTNCEYDSARAVERAGAKAEIFVIKNLSSDKITESVDAFAEKIKNSQAIFIPGGFSGGDEPDGSGKFITAFFRNARIKDAVTELLDERKGLMLGICNGFQALVKLGLVPFGKIIDTDDTCPTLTFNDIGRHQSRLVTTRVASVKSPWLKNAEVDNVYGVPISHGEGKFICNEKLLKQLIENGQIATQYVDLNGNPTYDIAYNPNGSVMAIEGITSPDGRVLGKMGHTERYDKGLYKNFDAEFDMGLFKSLVEYYK